MKTMSSRTAMFALAAATMATAASWGDAHARMDTTGLPPGLGGKRRRRRLIGEQGCWRPGPEHLPPPGKSRQVRRREALKAGVVKWRDMK